MENATKALLIAAAILVAIVIISIGMVVLRQGSDSVDQVSGSMTEAQIVQFNTQFKNYTGSSVSGKELNELCKKIIANNQNEKDTGDKRYVKITVTAGGSSETFGGDTDANCETGKANLGKYTKSQVFRVSVVQSSSSSGAISEMKAEEK